MVTTGYVQLWGSQSHPQIYPLHMVHIIIIKISYTAASYVIEGFGGGSKVESKQ